MSTTDARRSEPTAVGQTGTFDQKLEVVVVPVSDAERSKAFYQRLGWRLDATPPGRFQFTPPGSGTSVQFGASLTPAAPGSSRAFLVVSDIVAAREALIAAGVEVDEIFHLGADGLLPGPDPERRSYRSRATFADPDGNTWVLQEVTSRLPGRVEPATATYTSVNDLKAALVRAATAHAAHEQRDGGRYDEHWPEWYATYLIAEATGAELPD